ncbi:MAG: hypothetical protein ACJATI_003232 [Halioglobus sp.]|jgi:hypothetical protein
MKNLLILLLCLTSIANLSAQNAALSVQGVIKNSDGTAVDDGDYEITMRLYTGTNDLVANAIWTEEHPEVNVKGGVYSVLLGSINPLPTFSAQVFLGVSIEGGTELQPRSQLTSAPFALQLVGNENLIGGNGNIGIGTTSPTVPLEVVGDTKFNGSIDVTDATFNGPINGLLFKENGQIGIGMTDTALIMNDLDVLGDTRFTGASSFIGSVSLDSNWVSADGDTEGMRIDTSGDVEFSNDVTATNFRGDLTFPAVGSDFSVRRIRNYENTSTVGGFMNNISSTTWGDGDDFVIYTSDGRDIHLSPDLPGFFGGSKVAINAPFEVNSFFASKDGGGSWSDNSDRRLKKNIVDLDANEMLAKMLELQGVNYEWNDNKTGRIRQEGVKYGFIAQNIGEVFPDFISEDDKGYLVTAYGNYDAMLVECIRALNDKITKLETENANLKGDKSSIEKRLADLEKLVSSIVHNED